MLKAANEWQELFEMDEEQKRNNSGSSDFFGLNHYGSDIVRWADNSYEHEVRNITLVFLFQ